MSRKIAAALFGALCLSGDAARVERIREMEAAVQLHEGTAEEASDGQHVCCLEGLGANFKVSVYHAGRAQRDVRKCLLTSVADDCADQAQCVEKCVATMRANRRYHDLEVKSAERALKQAQADREKTYSQADRAQREATEKSKRTFDDAVAGPRKAVERATRALASEKSDLDVAQAALDKAKAALDAAQTDFNAKNAAKNTAEQKATEDKARAEAAAQSKSTADKQAADAVVAEKTKALGEVSKEATRYKAAAVPAACQNAGSDEKAGSSTGAVDCCCSINKQAVLVSGDDFVDWEKCKGAQAYSKRSLLSLPCGFLTPCNACASLICGKGICP